MKAKRVATAASSRKAVLRAFERALKRMFEHDIAFNRVLGLRVVSLDPQRPRVRIEMRPELVGNFVSGQLHGGVISATLDVVAGLAIVMRRAVDKPQDTLEAQFHQNRRLGTIDLRVDYLRPGKGAWFIASGQVVRMGARVAAVRMELENDDGELIASGSAAYMIG